MFLSIKVSVHCRRDVICLVKKSPFVYTSRVLLYLATSDYRFGVLPLGATPQGPGTSNQPDPLPLRDVHVVRTHI